MLSINRNASHISRIRLEYDGETRDLFRSLLSTRSSAEANFVVGILREVVPEKTLVSAVNLREVLRSLPTSPFSMRVDEVTLQKTASLKKDRAVLSKRLVDGLELAVTTAGNLVLDVIVITPEGKHFWSTMPRDDDFMNPALVDVLVESDELVDEVVDLVSCMGIVFNPTFYLSVEDWNLEFAADAMESIGDLF